MHLTWKPLAWLAPAPPRRIAGAGQIVRTKKGNVLHSKGNMLPVSEHRAGTDRDRPRRRISDFAITADAPTARCPLGRSD